MQATMHDEKHLSVYMLAHIDFLFDLRPLDVLLLYYYYYQALDKYKYYILCTFLYQAHELNEPARARKQAEPS
jgi:hypothetical protein